MMKRLLVLAFPMGALAESSEQQVRGHSHERGNLGHGGRGSDGLRWLPACLGMTRTSECGVRGSDSRLEMKGFMDYGQDI